MRLVLFSTIVIAVLLAITIQVNTVYAGVYSNQLTRCIIEAMDKQDKVQFSRYFVLMYSQSPEVQDMVSISEKQERNILENIAKLYSKLMTKSCKKLTKKVMKYEGTKGIVKSFTMLGRIRAQQIMKSKEVQEMFKIYNKYLTNELKKMKE